MTQIAQIQFDWSINVGTLVHLITLIVAMTVLYMKMSQRMETTERRVKRLYVWTKELIRVTPGVNPAAIAGANGEDRKL